MDTSVVLAKKLKLPPAIIGATLVSVGTTLPELLVTIFSSTANASGISIGNAVGSIIFNSCIIGGLLMLFTVVFLKRNSLFLLSLLLLSVVALAIINFDGKLYIYESILLLMIFSIFVYSNYKQSKSGKEPFNEKQPSNTLLFTIILFIISATMVGLGSYFLVNSAKSLAHIMHINETIIGLTIVSFGTSLPELVTTLISIKKGEPNIGLGNIVGSNIINCNLLIGITGINNAGGLSFTNETKLLGIPIALFATCVLLIPLLINKKSSKWQAILILSIYVIYFILLALHTFGIVNILH